MTISVRESGMPMTVSKNSPSRNVRPSTSKPSWTKNADTVSRSATVMPTWSKRQIPDMRCTLSCPSSALQQPRVIAVSSIQVASTTAKVCELLPVGRPPKPGPRIRGAEVTDLLGALNTGHDGGCGTVHANSAREVPSRLEALGVAAGLPRAALHSQLAAAVQVVVHLTRDRSGQRRVAELHALAADAGGLVRAVPAVTFTSRGLEWGPGGGPLRRLLTERDHPLVSPVSQPDRSRG